MSADLNSVLGGKNLDLRNTYLCNYNHSDILNFCFQVFFYLPIFGAGRDGVEFFLEESKPYYFHIIEQAITNSYSIYLCHRFQ